MSSLSLIQQFFQALLLLGLLVGIAVLIITMSMRLKQRTFLWKPFIRTYWLYIALVLYYLLVLCITCFSRSNIQSMNLRLFASYENAWFGGSIYDWQQLLLNIAMFIPLGAILTLVHPRLKHWYVTGLICFLGSLCIEVLQYLFRLGVFEVDDLLNNTLGGLLGYCFMMVFLKLKTKQYNYARRFGVLPFVIIGIGLYALFRYTSQPYGNLQTGTFFRYNWGDTAIAYEGNLSKKDAVVGMYQLTQVSAKEIDNTIQDLQHKLNLHKMIDRIDQNMMTTFYYEDSQIMINKQTGTWQFFRNNAQANLGVEASSGNLESALKVGEELGLLDEFAKVVNEDGSTAIWQWELNGKQDGRKGYLTIDCDNTGAVIAIQYEAIPYRYIRSEKIISQEVAYQKLQDGLFRPWRSVAFKSLTFKEAKLDYVLDTKNYLQPVYRFYGEGKKGGQEIVISALVN